MEEKYAKKDNSKFFDYSENRPLIINILLCLASFVGLLILPSLFALLLKPIGLNDMVTTFISDVLFVVILYLFYLKDLNREFKTFTKNIKKNIGSCFKIWGYGFLGMVVFNLILSIILKNISANETQVREMLFNYPLISLLTISLAAPFCEELIFRKSLQPVIKNKWIYVILCGVLFGGAHILTNIFSGEFILTDLLYIFPYASLGCAFALMDFEHKTTFSSIMMHVFHNTITAVFLLILYLGGNI